MKALQLSAPKQWEQIDIDEPSPPAAGEALVRIHRVGVCGTDLGGYLGKFPFFSYPRIPGHELGVEVVAVGEGVENVKVGDRCSVEPYINCQKCYSCERGLTNCCESHQTLGVMCDGGLTEKMILPARKLHPANNLSYEQSALVETLAIGCHAIDRANVTDKDTVLVIGSGPIGLSAIEFARVAGARVIVADLSQTRLDFVTNKMGVTDTIQFDGSEADIEKLEAMTDGRRADVVVDATGNHHSMRRAMEMAAFGGRVVYVGITQQDLQFPHAPFLHRRELTILASRNALTRDFSRIIQLIESGVIDTDPWITHHAKFEEVIESFPAWTDPESGVVKAVIHVS
ncbi:zinc-binding alcohol dehydrogenase family protein [Rhodopirellula europaea]|jgi:alcohol dehydrogenase|uniref:Zinc-type alcohol dehydrogenase protein n=2 Tax=Rhodopirellula europaea TaxID=1263866 RepID=M2A4M1_9BACT|nr:zinc-binding alcohol dehydrogenase family protein [Rhodopirellula europaea]EMB14686.1 zinc-type alcohol dehydrogenase protein [Rhodopirellula europaea 6C]EMI23960.1 zinc-type alcohol dehydrogenase protein [Rhodopirellula europaea SH398]|tara:strand:+ start:3077 stop:4105 length:1029 start_codon:yes stop_codon:yes gene_type:complete